MSLMISYAVIAQAVGKTEDEVRQDRKDQLVDLDSLNSVVEYVARAKGWIPPEQAVVAGAAPAPVEAGKQYSGTSAVRDNVEPSGDPYLERVRAQRGH